MAHKAAAATTGGGGGALRFEELVFRDGSRYDGHTKVRVRRAHACSSVDHSHELCR